MTGVTELQKKRAENMIWNAAGDYGFSPDFRAYDSEGRAQLYWNCIIGAARAHYDYPQLAALFAALDGYEDGDLYESLLWLGLENALCQRELPSRPALGQLRADYARELIRRLAVVDETGIYDAVALAHFQRALGLPTRLGAYDAKLLDELEFSPEMSTEEIVAASRALLLRWFQVDGAKKRRREATAPGLRKSRGKRAGKPRRFGLGFAEHPDGAYGGAATGRGRENEVATKLSAAELRQFMESKYGSSMLPPNKLSALERTLCTGSHQNCSLLLTRGGEAEGVIRNAFEALQKQKEAQQIQRNRKSFYDAYPRNMTEIAALAGKIQNSVLMHLQPGPARADSGSLSGALAWRAAKLDDGRVFIRDEQGDAGSLSVDILLDASTSQKGRQEALSNQGYMIAAALSRCGIPCRVMSFCSMTGYTILRIFRDYDESGANERIFDYVSNGCNRDGLAIRLVHRLMNGQPYEHKILIVLSDVKPNDIRKIRDRSGNELAGYEGDAGLEDTAREVRAARGDGIAVVCVFTGADEDLPAAKLVYGRDLTRIRSVTKFADAVGLLIQNRIRLL